MMTLDELQKHILATYFDLRVGVAAIAFLFPVILPLMGKYLGVEFQPSLSDYYHTYMRNGFVGMLFIIGAFMYLYRGFSNWENWLLNAAGLLAVCIALLPTDIKCRMGDLACEAQAKEVFSMPLLHGISSVMFFIVIALVCITCSRLTLSQIKENGYRKKLYAYIYWILGFLMVALPLTAAGIARFTELANPDNGSHIIFWVEYAGVWVFATYWLVKSIEIHKTESDKHAADLSFIQKA